MNVINIVAGFWNKALSRNQELKDFRIQNACIKCPLYVKGWCSSSREGCGCLVSAKTTVQQEKCPQGIWSNDWVNTDRLKEIQKKYTSENPIK